MRDHRLHLEHDIAGAAASLQEALRIFQELHNDAERVREMILLGRE